MTAALLDAPRRPKPRGSRKLRPSEAQIQISIKQRLVFLGCYVAHIPNAAKRSKRAGVRIKQEGMVPGFPDLAVYGGGYNRCRHALLEVKRPDYKLSDVQDNQRDCHAALLRRGWRVHIVTSQDEAVRALQDEGWVF